MTPVASRVPPPSAFARRIYRLAGRIPRGFVSTYGELARAAGCGSARAVGQALRRNPFAPEIPCHRVIASDLRPGGFLGARGGALLSRKLKLLEGEGVVFENGRLADSGRLYRYKSAERRPIRRRG
ncbi:MAG: MGMT family protein [Kiritimatiellia bacterium]